MASRKITQPGRCHKNVWRVGMSLPRSVRLDPTQVALQLKNISRRGVGRGNVKRRGGSVIIHQGEKFSEGLKFNYGLERYRPSVCFMLFSGQSGIRLARSGT